MGVILDAMRSPRGRVQSPNDHIVLQLATFGYIFVPMWFAFAACRLRASDMENDTLSVVFFSTNYP